MIMAAGVGSRLMPMTANIPKPMVPVGNKPLMENIVKLLKGHGFNDIIANLHYHADMIRDYFADGSGYGVSLQYSPETELLGTAGGVKKCAWFLDDTFVVVSGDALTDIDLSRLVAEHKRKGALATIALKEVAEVNQFGIVITEEDGRINSFQEKPSPAEALSNLANTGIYIFEPEIFDYILAGSFYDFGKELFPHLVKIGAPFFGIKTERYWCDVGNINTYRQANIDILQGLVRVETSGNLVATEEKKVLLGEGTKLGENVILLGNVVIGKDCYIEDNVVINNAVIWDNTIIGRHSMIEEAVIGSGCKLGEQVKVYPGAVVASNCLLPGEVAIREGERVAGAANGALQFYK